MQNLFATLAYIGASASDVVQVKAFINPIEDAIAVEEVIAAFFRGQQVPPIVMVEWLVDENKAEIELVASAPEHYNDKEAVSYYAPPWMIQATTYSRIVDIKKEGYCLLPACMRDMEKMRRKKPETFLGLCREF